MKTTENKGAGQMNFKVTLRNQMTGQTVERDVKCQYDAASVVGTEAKRQMKLPAAWDVVKCVRVPSLDEAEGQGRR